MPNHVVQQGEDLLVLADQYGFVHWETIYFDDRNAGFRARRPDPFALQEGDALFVPERARGEVETGARHTFVLYTPRTVWVRLQLENHAGEPYADCRYELNVEGETFTGETSAEGLMVAEVPASAEEGTLRAWIDDGDEPHEWEVQLGDLAPAETDRGVEERLVNLGYLSEGSGQDELGPAAREALRTFQEDAGLEPTGDADRRTRSMLWEVGSSGHRNLLLPCRTGKSYTFRLNPPRTFPVRLELQGHDGTPYARCRYELEVDSELYPGKTDGDGLIEVDVPRDAMAGVLRVWLDEQDEPHEWELELGGTDAPATVESIERRLINLGYLSQAEGGTELGPTAREALALFQDDVGLTPTGEPDRRTVERLQEVSGF